MSIVETQRLSSSLRFKCIRTIGSQLFGTMRKLCTLERSIILCPHREASRRVHQFRIYIKSLYHVGQSD